MSVIERMSIMGIRSFGPEDQNKQVIEFFKPLTLILGPNGSGKTTIIECLRYMTTGDPPPNSERGASFVYDPKLAGESDVKAQVKLQFWDVLHKKVVTTRSLMASQKLKKIQLKTLESTIQRYGAHNEKTDLSSKCADIDAEMIGFLGVSKAILNNVIFCHQEESNWPLSEGKALKQRFDEIFAATRYIKALDEIRKTRLEKMTDVKLYKTEAESLKHNRRKASEFTKDLEKTECRLAACKDTIVCVENKLKPISNQLKEIALKENEIGSLQFKLVSNTDIIDKFEKDEGDLRSTIKIIFNGSKEELVEEMKNFDALVSERKEKLTKVKHSISDLEFKHQVDVRTKSKLQEELGKFKSEQQRHQQRVKSRDAKLRELRKSFGLGELGFDEDEPLIESQVENVIKNLKNRNNATQNELISCKSKHEAVEQELQSNIDKTRVENAKKQQKLTSSNEQIEKNKKSIQETNNELRHVNSLSSRQIDLEEELKETEEELVAIECSINVQELREQVTEGRKRKKEIDVQQKTLSQEMIQLQKETQTRTLIDQAKKELSTKQEAVDKILAHHKDAIVHLLHEMPSQGVKEKVDTLAINLSEKIDSIKKDIDKENRHLSSLETTKNIHLKQLDEKNKILNDHRNKIFDVCGSQDFDVGFEQLQDTIKELQDEKGALTGSLYLYNKYVEKLGTPRPICPLCTRSFENTDDVQVLIRDLQRKLQSVPTSLDKKTRLISEKQKVLNNMLELKPIKDAIVELSEKDIPNMTAAIVTVKADIVKTKAKISDLEEILDDLSSDWKTALAIAPDLITLNDSLKEMDRKKRQLTNWTYQLGSKDISRTIEQVSDEQSSLQDELKSLSDKIDTTQQRINDHGEHIQRLKSRINDLRTEKVEIASSMQKKVTLMQKLDNLSSENDKLTESLKEVRAEISILETKMKKILIEKNAASREKENELEKIRTKIKTEEMEMENIDQLSRDINRYITEKREMVLINHEEKLKKISTDIDSKMKHIGILNQEEKELNKDIASQELNYRDLEDNQRLKDTTEKIARLQAKCRMLKEKIGNHDLRSLLNEKERLNLEERKLMKERDESEGRQKALREQVNGLKRQLQDEMFKDADKKHRNMMIQLKTTELACEDLSKYYTALNRALMNYHQMKMTEINKIVKELWCQTYAGNDIDYIEIQSNEDDADAGLEKARRQYNYKVVMIKGDHRIDMRGRCSAGQKVLASLMIRLALAETFCLNCGILALDEPTTNLDRENISSLAHALIQIVKTRSEQRNFQLVVITHDEDFIELLGRSETVDYYYRVSKDSNAFSKVSRCSVSSMN